MREKDLWRYGSVEAFGGMHVEIADNEHLLTKITVKSTSKSMKWV